MSVGVVTYKPDCRSAWSATGPLVCGVDIDSYTILESDHVVICFRYRFVYISGNVLDSVC